MVKEKEQEFKSWTTVLRFLTPFFLFILTLITSEVSTKLNTIDEKLFKHLTNDEMHTPRSITITKAEFSIYQQMRDKQMEDIKDLIKDIGSLLKDHIKEDRI